MSNKKDKPEIIEGIVEENTRNGASQLTEIEKVYGDNLPYNKNRLINEVKFIMNQTGEGMLQMGSRLVRLKETEPHGEFIRIIDQDIGLTARAAQKMMQAAVKFLNLKSSNAPSMAHLSATKLLDLMTQDDDDLEALAEGGTVAGLTLNEIDSMSTRALRERLKKAEDQRDAARRVSNQKDDKINELSEENTKLEMKIEKSKKGAEKLALDADPKAEITKSCLLSLADVTSTMQASTTELIQILNRAEAEKLSLDFFKQMALAVSQVYRGLDDILRDLPEDVDMGDEWTPEA